MRESVRIRREALGLHNAETAVAYVKLGELEGLPANTHKEPAAAEAAARQIRFGLELLPDCPNADPSDTTRGYKRLAETYARNGLTRETLATVTRHHQAYSAVDIEDLSRLLSEAGDPRGAERLQRELGPDRAGPSWP